jgi:DNA-binding response OmpR family regulator
MADSGEGDAAEGTVIVADDNEKVTDLYAGYLDPRYEVRRAYGGEETLERADGGVDVVLLDRQMPDLSGDDVLDELREREHSLQVVMVTALEPTMDVVDMPFDDYVVKPATEEELHEVVERQIVRANYDTRLNEYLRLTSKLDMLREEKSEEELEESDRFEMLTVLAQSLYDDIQEMLDEHDLNADEPEELIEPP